MEQSGKFYCNKNKLKALAVLPPYRSTVKFDPFNIFSLDKRLSLNNLIGADIAAASVLISMGALLGRISPIQLLIMGLIEISIFASNEFLQIELMKARDEKIFID